MPHIQSIEAIEILDSRGNPTLSVEVRLKCGITARAAVPSGASTGEHEAKELRDGNKDRYQGKGVLQAARHVEGALQTLLSGENVLNQSRIDALMIEADGTENKERFGANAILGISLACARAAARHLDIELFQYLGGNLTYLLPCPMLNIINGGVHADNSIEFQEFMIRPHAAATFQEALRAGTEVFHTLKKILHKNNLVTSVGDEGGFAPNLQSDEEALSLICEAITISGYTPGKDISLALDCAASSLFDPVENCYIEMKKRQKQSSYEKRNYKEQVHYLQHLAKNYPIDSIEDGLAENDWEGWRYMTEKMGKEVQIVGDDIFVTNPKFLERGIKEGCANAILIKVNQIGTLTETFRTIQDAHKHNYRTVISHRSGETEDSFIADLAVACHAGQIKTGAPCRSDRVAKYNRLLEIERKLRPYATYMDSNAYSKGLL